MNLIERLRIEAIEQRFHTPIAILLEAADALERLELENSDLRDFHDMVINWPRIDAKTSFEIMDRCKKYET